MRVRAFAPIVAVLALATTSDAPALAGPARAPRTGALVAWIRSRDDLAPAARRRWEAEIKRRFGPLARAPEREVGPELGVARAILSVALFMRVDPSAGVSAALEGWKSATGQVPPLIAIQYELLALQGQKPRGRPIELAFKFPEYFSEEVAPDLVAFWDQTLREGRVPDDARGATLAALEATRQKMPPLLLDRLRLLARLDRELRLARGVDRAERERDLKELEDELARAFERVSRRPEVLDRRKRPFDRLRIELEDRGLSLTIEDRYLDPDGPVPPRRPVPQIEEVASAPDLEGAGAQGATDDPLPIPDQARPGDPNLHLEEPPALSGPVVTGPRDAGVGEAPAVPPAVPSEPARRAAKPRSNAPPSHPLLEPLSRAYRLRIEETVAPWLDTPYVFGGASAGLGTDASGFTRGVLADGFGVDLPRLIRDQFRVGRSVPRDRLRPGDLVFFDTLDAGRVSHVGVYAGGGKFAHAAVGKGVVYARLDARDYGRAYRGARRLLVYPD